MGQLKGSKIKAVKDKSCNGKRMSWKDKESALNLWIDLMLILFLLHQLKKRGKIYTY